MDIAAQLIHKYRTVLKLLIGMEVLMKAMFSLGLL
jgi:hypothetical protein